MSGLPTGWVSSTLGEIAKWGSGGTPKGRDPRYYGGDIPWAVIGDLNDGRVLETADTITELGLAESSAKIVPEGAVLIAMYGSIGKLGIAGRDLTTNQAIAFAVPHEQQMSAAFLFHFLMSQRDVFIGSGKGATQQNISQTLLKGWPVVVPPMEEQRAIVEILEDHLSRLDAARAGLGTVALKGEQFRKSYLRHLFAVVKRTVPLQALLATSIGGVWGKEPGNGEVDVDVLRVTELRPHGVLDPSTAARRSVTTSQLNSRRLQAGDLLLEKSGGGPNTPVGRVGLVVDVPANAICSNFMQLMRPDASLVLPEYLHLYLGHLHNMGGTAALQTASTNIRNIKASEYLLLEVPVPTLAEQADMVQQAELALSSIGSVKRAVVVGDAGADRVRRSLLAAAFRGDLTREWRERHG